MSAFLADAPPVADLLDVFNSYDGGVIFRGLTAGVGGQPAVLGGIGWIFTGCGALFVLWGFVLRTSRSGGEGKMGEIATTWIVIALMLGGPLVMRAAMEAADAVYLSSVGGPRDLTTACVKAAYAMPELTSLFDALRRNALKQQGGAAAQASQRRETLINDANDGSALGYIEAFGVAVWDTAADKASSAGQTWDGMVRLATMASGFGSAMLKCLLIIATIGPLYLLLLGAAAIVWFMEQLRYFFAVTGTMMLPLFIGLFSLPGGHFSRQAAQGYVMHMISLALWPVSWAIGHTGTVALYNALIALIAGTSRVPDLIGILQWSSITGSGPSEAQVRATEAALGNWFMGNVTGLLSILVGGLGFVAWVAVVSVLGPVFLHKLLSTGAHFVAQATASAGRGSVGAGRLAVNAAQSPALGGGGFLGQGLVAGERLAGAPSVEAKPLAHAMGYGVPPGAGGAGASMARAASGLDDSDGTVWPSV